MDKSINSILISPADDVATTIVELQEGDWGRYMSNRDIITLLIQQPIPQFHKFAVRDITRGEAVRKYGEVIGEATLDIRQGCHVHEHNIASAALSCREGGEK